MDFDNLNISDELREKAKACNTPEELLALAKKEGYKLSNEDLAKISGSGWSAKDALPQCPNCQSYEVSMSSVFGSPGATACRCSKCGYSWINTPFG